VRRRGAVALGVLACAAGFAIDAPAMLRSYLWAWLFALALSLGALANLMVLALTGGAWGETVRPALAAAARALPAVALLFAPVLLGAQLLFPGHDDAGWWQRQPLFTLRALAYLALWSWLAGAWRRAPCAGLAAAGLVIYAFSVSLAAFDWIVALEPGWYSSGFGLVVGVGQMLVAFAFAVAAAYAFGSAACDEAARGRWHDLGNLLLTYVLTWAYLAYTQFLVIWSENLPREIAWYLPRLQTSWVWLGGALVALHFALPLAILLSRVAKRSPALLAALAATLVVAHLADVYWLVMPAFRRDGFALAWSDAAALAGVGAVWAALWNRARRDG